MGLWILISRKTWTASLLLMAASLRRKENKSDFPLSLSLLYLLSTYYVPRPVLVTGGHHSEQKGTDKICPLGASVSWEGPGASSVPGAVRSRGLRAWLPLMLSEGRTGLSLTHAGAEHGRL